MKLNQILMIESRLKKNLTQIETAELTGISQPTISRVEDGARLPMRMLVAYVRSGLLSKAKVFDLVYSYDLDTSYTSVKKIKCLCGHSNIYHIIDRVKCAVCGAEL